MKLKPVFSPFPIQVNLKGLLCNTSVLVGLLIGVSSAQAKVRTICADAYAKAGAIPAGTRSGSEYMECWSKAYGSSISLLGQDRFCAGWPLADSEDIPEYCGGTCHPDIKKNFLACLEDNKKKSALGELGYYCPAYLLECVYRKNKGEPKTCEGNPCDPITGNKFETETDYRSANGHLNVIRYYNSLAPKKGAFGFGWTNSLTPDLTVDSSTSIPHIGVQRPDGYGEVWKKLKDEWKSEPDSNLSIQENRAGFAVTRPDGGIEQYDEDGRLIKKTDRNGLSTQYKYDSGRLKEVIGPYSRKLTISYNTSRLISTVNTPDGTLRYEYDGQDNLIKVTYPDNTTREYLYGEKEHISSSPEKGVDYTHSLTGLIDENNVRFATWAYDKKGKATSSEHAGGVDKVTLDHQSAGKTEVTGPLGDTRTYEYAYYHNVAKVKKISGDQCSDCGSGHMKERTYDKNGNLASSTDHNGNLTCYAYDLTRNVEIIRLEGLPSGKFCPKDLAAYTPSEEENSTERKITTQWHELFRLPIAVAEPLRLTTTSYDAKGRLKSQAVQATKDSTGGAGLKAQKIGKPRTTSYRYTKTGQIKQIDGPRTDLNDITTFSYDKQGNLVTVTNALKQVTKLGNYDPSGRPCSITDSNGLVTTLAYDLRGRLKSIKKGNEETIYTYDKAGSLIRISLPGGGEYSYTYDPAHRLIDITDKDGNRIHFTLDKAGNRIKEEIRDRNGKAVQVRSREFNKLSRLVKEVGAVNQTTVYEYDDNGNLIKITDPLKRTVVNQYDALNRLITSTDPDGNPTHYSYDSQDQLVWVTDPRKLGTQYTRDGLNNLTKTVSPDTGTTTATFDAAGNLLTRVDAKGQKAVYSYDVLNRLTSISYAGAAEQNITYTYDQGKNGIGRLTGIKDITGIVTYCYDQQGRLIKEQRQSYGQNYTTIYSYDTQGRLQQIAYPSGRTINYSFDAQGRIQQITTTVANQTKTVIRNVLYHPFGGVHQFTFGNGQKYTREYDQDGRIASYTLDDTPYTIAYDAASQITAISGSGKTANYTYDLLSRLTQYTQGSDLQSFSYDAIGNRLSKTEGRTTTNYTYSSTSNQLMGLQEQGQRMKKISYDPNGSTVEDAERQYAYDAKGRLMKTVTAEGAVEYSVNALGLRIRKKAPQSDTVYHYDRDGRLIAENTTGTRKFSREYIYLGDQPVAVLR